ncbi:unnamed protein product [Medioppia subpectinata]|uniref:Cationic amino acid transporter C-terminal domain-containing protein n=1 Tax=Medioppia subpectinata TaxID=1979941 RepID=A0A7R9PW66_9ACAR|nr:unnamed protein product [Medioppia subpectinata]CAG2102997.1 unnamed protein product [Medioppia subpectinata]
MIMGIKYVLKALVRRKTIDAKKVDDSQLKRCLSFFDLTCLGIGSTLGLGVYVLAGEVAGKTAGPSVCISFLVAAIASVFAGLCYAEFGSRVPRAGSAYLYSYITVGEFMAFVIGWNIILENVIGTASVARGYSVYIDALCDNKISDYFTSVVPMNMKGLAAFPDPIAFGLTLGLTVLLALGVKESIRLHTVMTVCNLVVLVFVIVAGLFKADIHNWKIDKSEIPAEYNWGGNGGFFPNGFSGMMAGAAACFYAFVGFDAIATTGEEAKNPKRNIPLSICFSLMVIFMAYFGISAVQTLMYPYYLQHKELTNGAALPYVFDKVGWHWAKWVVSIGALNGLSTALLGAMYPLPRVLYSMGSDGVIFRFMAIVHPRFKTPIYATLLSGILASVMAAIFDLDQLTDMMSIGTLLAYTLVAESIVIIRYSDDVKEINEVRDESSDSSDDNLSTDSKTYKANLAYNTTLVFLQDDIFGGKVAPIITASITLALICVTVFCLMRQPMIQKSRSFEVPGVPVIPLLSVFINVYLMFNLSYDTWIRFLVWMILGLLMYGLYGIRNSSERVNRKLSDDRVVVVGKTY